MARRFQRRFATGGLSAAAVVLSIPALAVVATAVPAILRPGPARPPARAPADVARVVATTRVPTTPPRPPKIADRAGPIPTGAAATPPDLAASASFQGLFGAAASRDGGAGLVGLTAVAPLWGGTLARLDALGGGGARGPVASGALQVFLRDPRLGAAGLYLGGGSYAGVDVLRGGLAGSLGTGPVTADVTVGYESVGGRRAFFDMVDVVYHPREDLALSVGHRRVDGRDLAAAGVSARIADGVSIVGEGRVGPGLPGRDLEVAGLIGLRLSLGAPAPASDALPSRLVEDVLVPPSPRR